MLDLFAKFLSELSPEDKSKIREMLEDKPVDENNGEDKDTKPVEPKEEEKTETKSDVVEENEEPLEKENTESNTTEDNEAKEEAKTEETQEVEEKATEEATESEDTQGDQQVMNSNPIPDDSAVVETSEDFIALDSLASKDFVKEITDGLSAKIDALVKENQSLTEQNAKLRDKYESKDFGNVKPSQNTDDKTEVETFDSYWKS